MEKFWKYKIDHILFWTVTIGFHIYTRIYLIGKAGFGVFAGEILLRNVLLAIIIYTHSGYLIPAFAQQKKFLQYLLGLVLCFLFYITLMDLHNIYVYNLIGGKSAVIWQNSFYNLSISLFYTAFSVALLLSKEWFFQREQLRLMEIEKLNAELEYLKLQINPHFLFNSLNTIYFQIEKTNGLARDTLLKFSDLLRYPLYECNGKEVKLEKELHYLKNYFDLQRLRKEEHYNVTFDCTITDGHQTLAPLLLVPFVENAFKHVSHYNDRPNEIRIAITKELNELEMKVFNTKDDAVEKSASVGGIGLKNVRRRLEIIYGSDFFLDVRESTHEYEVHLKIPLHEAELSDRR